MRQRFTVYHAAGLAVAACLVFGILYWTRGAHLELKGSIRKVRTQAMDEASSVAVIDFRFVNPSDYLFVVRAVEVSLEDAQGRTHQGAVVSEVDAKRLFQFYPLLGQKFNDTLVMRDRILARQSMDRMVAARFETPEARLETRKRLVVRVLDVDGAVSEIVEGAR